MVFYDDLGPYFEPLVVGLGQRETLFLFITSEFILPIELIRHKFRGGKRRIVQN